MTFLVRDSAGKTKEQTIARTDLVRWGGLHDVAEHHQIVLVDGSLLVANIDAFEDGKFSCKSLAWGRFEIESESVAGVNLMPARDYAKRHRQLGELQSASGEAMLLMNNGDRQSGTVDSIDPGRDQDLRLLHMKTDSDSFDFSFTSVSSFSLGVEPQQDEIKVARIGFTDGSLLNVSNIQVQQEAIELQLNCGATIYCRNGRQPPLAAISYIQPATDRVSYLSDQRPLQAKTIPLLTAKHEMQMDESVTGAPLRQDEKLYSKGIGMHSTSSAAFNVDDSWKRFAAELAIDDNAGQHGSVLFRVFLLGKSGQWQPAFESEIVRGGDDAVPISVDLNNASAIALSVDQSDRGDIMDRANWLNARFEK